MVVRLLAKQEIAGSIPVPCSTLSKERIADIAKRLRLFLPKEVFVGSNPAVRSNTHEHLLVNSLRTYLRGFLVFLDLPWYGKIELVWHDHLPS